MDRHTASLSSNDPCHNKPPLHFRIAGCVDTDYGSTDVDGDSCITYTVSPEFCGNYDDDDFNSMAMCCYCGGGRSGGCMEHGCQNPGFTKSWIL